GALDFATGRVKMSILRRRITQAEIASFSYELCFDRCTNPNCGGIMWHSREWPPGKDWKGEAKCMGDCENPITELNKKWKPDEFFNIICEYRCNHCDFGGVEWHDGSVKFQPYESILERFFKAYAANARDWDALFNREDIQSPTFQVTDEPLLKYDNNVR
ncbi:hypothetical protein F5887DRAFT_1018331, partial [Amanita rubescens]